MDYINNQTSSLGQTGQFHSGLADTLYNFFGVNTAQQQNDFNAAQAALTRDFNSAEAQKQRDYEERLANTAFQRAVADMQAAGLNTALAYSQGGASVPSGASANGGSSAHAAASGNLVGLLGGVVGALSSVAKAAISANSAKSVAQLANYRDLYRTNFGYREVSWKE